MYLKRLACLAMVLLPVLALASVPPTDQAKQSGTLKQIGKLPQFVFIQQKEEVKPLILNQPPIVRGKGYKPLTSERRAHFQAISKAKHGNRITVAARNLSLPASFDCRVKSPLPIGDQGQCGSCYLYSTVRTMTDSGVLIGAGKADGTFALSVQYGMDRPRNFGGCNGGNGTEVIDWACNNGWIAEKYIDAAGVVHNDYPAYQASSGTDRTKPGAKVWVKGWTWGFVNSNGSPTIDEIKAAMYLHGRLNVSLDAGGQFSDGTSTITSLGKSIDHEINCVAWDDNKDGGALLLENQWNTSWGVNGCRWVTYAAARNIVDLFWVSAGVVPPPTPPDPPAPPTPPVPPAPTGKAPFKLWTGDAPNFTQVGTKAGYTTMALATKAATPLATSGKQNVLVYDASTPALLVVTITPDGPPPVPSNITITLTVDQVNQVMKGVGTFTVSSDMTLQEVIYAAVEAYEKLKKKPMPPMKDVK